MTEIRDSELYAAASRLVVKEQKASRSLLQRTFRIGYSKAMWLIQAMEEEGLITASDPLGQRQVLVGSGYFVAVDAEITTHQEPDNRFVAAAKESLAESRAGLPHLGEIRRHADRLRRLEAAFDAGQSMPSDLPVSLSRAAAFLDAFVQWVETHGALRSTPQEGTTDELTRSALLQALADEIRTYRTGGYHYLAFDYAVLEERLRESADALRGLQTTEAERDEALAALAKLRGGIVTEYKQWNGSWFCHPGCTNRHDGYHVEACRFIKAKPPQVAASESQGEGIGCSALVPLPDAAISADACSGCGGPYRFDTSVPSAVWNAVVRKAGLPEFLCTTCIIEAFVKADQSFTAVLIGAGFSLVPITVEIRNRPALDAVAVSEENNTLRCRVRELEAAESRLTSLTAQRDEAIGRYTELFLELDEHRQADAKRSLFCVYCAESIRYTVGDDIGTAAKAMEAHDAACPKNPLVATILRLRQERASLTQAQHRLIEEWRAKYKANGPFAFSLCADDLARLGDAETTDLTRTGETSKATDGAAPASSKGEG